MAEISFATFNVFGWCLVGAVSDMSEAYLLSNNDCTKRRCFAVNQLFPVNILRGLFVDVASQHIETESPVTIKLSAQAKKPK